MKRVVNNESRVLVFGYILNGQPGNQRLIPGVNEVQDVVFSALENTTSFRRKMDAKNIEAVKNDADFSDMTQARQLKAVDTVHDPAGLRALLQKTNNTKVKAAIKEKLKALETAEEEIDS